MKKEFYEKIINLCLKKGCEFSEVYYEKKYTNNYILLDSKLDNITTSNKEGIGIRISKNGNIYYGSTSNLTEKNITELVQELLENIETKEDIRNKTIKLNNLVTKKMPIKIKHNDFSIQDKINILKDIDKQVRKYSSLIRQVNATFYESYKEFTVANSNGKFIASDEVVTRIGCLANAEKNGQKENHFKSYGSGQGYEFLNNFDLEQFSKEVAEVVIKKLDSKKFKGGKIPVILGNGFGAIIFHEACGHGLEATSVNDGLSVFSNKLNQKIASDKVTLIDDATIPNAWGTTLIDSEGNQTKKNILIQDGILKNFLIDDLKASNMNMPSTSSGRRENYMYPPTSRMNNTYLAPGNDNIEDMIKSIKYGIYCKSLIGGSVDTITGDFNFSSGESYLIENGKISDMLSGITLIGKGQEVLKNVEMVSNDLVLDTGFCGSESGLVHVTVGQPTIKIKEILVGGESE